MRHCGKFAGKWAPSALTRGKSCRDGWIKLYLALHAPLPRTESRATQRPQRGETTMQLNVNNQVHEIDVEPEMPLLWALRE
ncbi:MAG: hypothetical protein ABL931_09020, partial [Usitatibacteraceae bacterium]